MTQIIDQLPLPVPSRTDPTNFSVRADNFLGELPDFATQVNALATELTALGNTVETNKNTAVTAANNAQASAFAATGSANNAATSSGAVLWVSGTTYSLGALVYSPITGRTYRRKIAGAGTTDPSADATNWIPIVLEISTQYPTIRPSLNLDFVNNKYLDPRITFTRSTIAKYYDGKTVHKAEENLLMRSEEFDNADWTKISTTVTANTQVNPFGQSTSETLTETVANATHGIYQTIGIVTDTSYTFSVYAKYSTRQHIQLILDDEPWDSSCYANFDLQNGVLGTVGAGVSALITAVGNGWYRCSITSVSPADTSSSTCQFYILTANSSSMGYYGSYTGSTSNSVYIFGAQVEQRNFVGPYQATTTQPITNFQSTLVTSSINQPRFDHDPVTKECKGLFIEGATTNRLTYSEDTTNAIWSKINSTVSAYNNVISPDGSLSARKLVESTATGTHGLTQSFSVTSGLTYTASAYFKRGGQNAAIIELASTFGTNKWAIFDLQNGVVGTVGTAGIAEISSIGNGWYRCSVSAQATSTGTGVLYLYIARNSTDSSANWTGDGYSGIYIWGAQLEADSASPSSYVATSGSTASRGYDNAVMTGSNFSSWYNQEEGSVYSEVRLDQKPLSGYYNNNIFNIASGTTNLIEGLVNTDYIPANNTLYNDVQQSAIWNPTVYSFGTILKQSISFSTNDIRVSNNSSTVVSDNSGVLPKGFTELHLGSQFQGTSLLRGYMRRFTYYPKKLTNQELQTLTAI